MIIAYQALFKLLYTYFLFNLPQIFDVEIFVAQRGYTRGSRNGKQYDLLVRCIGSEVQTPAFEFCFYHLLALCGLAEFYNGLYSVSPSVKWYNTSTKSSTNIHYYIQHSSLADSL